MAAIFSDRGISIEAIIQKPPAEGETRVQVIILTNTTLEGRLLDAETALQALPGIVGDITRIRVETLDG